VPQRQDGLGDRHCSIIRNNLGLALQYNGHTSAAQEQYQHAIRADSGQVIKCHLRVSSGKPVSLASLLQHIGLNTVQAMAQEQLRLVIGDADQPMDCVIDVQGDVLLIHIIRAAMWDEVTESRLVTDVGFLQVLRDQILTVEEGTSRFERGLNRRWDFSPERKLNGHLIFWCDTAGIEAIERFTQQNDSWRRAGYATKFYNSAEELLYDLKTTELELSKVKCIITSGMSRSGRKQKGLLDCFEMATEVRKLYFAKFIQVPIFGLITASVSEADALAHKFGVYCNGSWVVLAQRTLGLLAKHDDIDGGAASAPAFFLDVKKKTKELELGEVSSDELLVDDLGEGPEMTSKVPRLLLSDVSQASTADAVNVVGSLASIGKWREIKEVVLTEVVRSSRRIVEGVRAFQTNDDDDPTKCHHGADGPPLKVILLNRAQDAAARDSQCVSKLVEAIVFLSEKFDGFDFHDRVAIIAPSSEFISKITPALEAALHAKFSGGGGGGFWFVTAVAASQIIVKSGKRAASKQCLVLDTVDNFNGLERLIVIAVDLDSPIELGAAAETRSQLYRAITRSQMMVVVVNEVLRGGWLEFLTCVKYDDEACFDAARELKKNVRGSASKLLKQQQQHEHLPATPPVAAPMIVRGRVEVKMKRIFGRDKWLKAMGEYNPAAHKFSCTDSTGKELIAMDCWLVDVANRQGKRQHRFDIESDGSQQPMALAAEGIGEKQRWVAAVETKETLRARQEPQARREQELMVKHGESTIEEAQRKEAKAAQGQKEEEDCVTSVVWDTSMNTIAGIESTPSASL
jgi:hypothetical protein